MTFREQIHQDSAYQSPKMKSILRLAVSVAGYRFQYPQTSEVPPKNVHLMRVEQANSPIYSAFYGRLCDEIESTRMPVRFRSAILDEFPTSHTSSTKLRLSSFSELQGSIRPSSSSDDNLTLLNNSAQTVTSREHELTDVDEWEDRAITNDLYTLNHEAKKTASQRVMALFRRDQPFPHVQYQRLKEEKCPTYEFSQEERKLKEKKNKKRSILFVVRHIGASIKQAFRRK